MSNVSTSYTFLRRWVLSPEKLFTSDSSETPQSRRTAKYRLTVPDSRLKVKQSILFVPSPGDEVPTDVSGAAPQLWVVAKDKDTSGILGYDVPTTNVLGTSVAPIVVITTPRIFGYSLETDGSATDYFEGEFSALVNGAQPKGTWYVAALYQPYVVRFDDREWNALRTLMNLTVKG